MGNSETKLLDEYWDNTPIKIVEMYRDGKSPYLPKYRDWFRKKSPEILKLESVIKESMNSNSEKNSTEIILLESIQNISDILSKKMNQQDPISVISEKSETTKEDFVLPYGKHKGKNLSYLSKHHSNYFDKIINNPYRSIEKDVNVWISIQIKKDPKKAPIGIYQNEFYDKILEIDPSYIFRAIDGKEKIISDHISIWAKENFQIIERLRKGFLGENLVGLILERILSGKLYQREFSIKELPKRRYDYMFEYGKSKILLEYDGEQHFIFPNGFHKTYEIFIDRTNADKEKTIAAINSGYKLIRISYLNFSNLREHIEKALHQFTYTQENYYFSDPELYRNFIDN